MKNCHLRFKFYQLTLLIVAGIGLFFAGLIIKTNFNEIRQNLLGNSVIVHFLHTYHSLRKLPDILFAPYLIADSKLDTYNLYIKTDDQVLMNSALPEDPISDSLANENRIWVSGIITAGNYSTEVDVRYRGTNANHWNSLQKSFKIKFPSDDLYQGVKSMSFIIPYDRMYIAEPLNFYRAKKLGLTTLDLSFSRLRLNGEDMGVYLTMENWTDEWIEKRRLDDNTVVYGADDGGIYDNPELEHSPLFIDTVLGKYYWNLYTTASDPASFKTFANVIVHTDDKTFKQVIGNILDLEKFYAWNIVHILAGSNHHGYSGNIFLLFSPVTGRFELSPWDVDIMSVADRENKIYDDRIFALSQRIFSVPEFRKARNEMLAEYLRDGTQFADDLAFYDDLFQQTKTDFYQDNVKLYNNFQFRNQIKKFRDLVIDNYERAQGVLTYDQEYYDHDRQSAFDVADFELGGSFTRFFETGDSIDDFITAHPSFLKQSDDQILLPRGVYTFRKDIVIPTGIHVFIQSGTTIYLDQGVSVLIHGSLTADAFGQSPIRFLSLSDGEAWGSLAVINAGRMTSYISNVQFTGGSGATINGMRFTGMVAFHNADVNISHSVFTSAGDDDGLNIKFGKILLTETLFENNRSDGVDIDFAADDSLVSNNTFVNNGLEGGGDAIDLSWSDIVIQGNSIDGCSDKGISVGESSHPEIRENSIKNCDIAIAVKDLSEARIIDNTISDNRVAISAYQKKNVFGGGTAFLENNIYQNNGTEHETDSLSVITNIE